MTNVKTNSIKAWLLAARPKTLTGAAIPVMLGCALAFIYGHFQLTPALLCFLFAFLMQIDANFINDLFDFLKGSDREDRLGPERACAQGWIRGCTYYVMAHDWNMSVTMASLACGLIIDTLLMINNFRDREQDAISGKKTIVVRLGAKAGLILYFLLGLAACWCCFYFLEIGKIYAVLLPQLYLIPHILTTQHMARIYRGKALNGILGETSRNMLIFGLLLTLGLIL